MGLLWDFNGIQWDLPSGKATTKTIWNMMNMAILKKLGFINELQMAMFKFANCKRLPEGKPMN